MAGIAILLDESELSQGEDGRSRQVFLVVALLAIFSIPFRIDRDVSKICLSIRRFPR